MVPQSGGSLRVDFQLYSTDIQKRETAFENIDVCMPFLDITLPHVSEEKEVNSSKFMASNLCRVVTRRRLLHGTSLPATIVKPEVEDPSEKMVHQAYDSGVSLLPCPSFFLPSFLPWGGCVLSHLSDPAHSSESRSKKMEIYRYNIQLRKFPETTKPNPKNHMH